MVPGAPDWAQEGIAVVEVSTIMAWDRVPETKDWLACSLVRSLRARVNLFFISSSTKLKHDENEPKAPQATPSKPKRVSHHQKHRRQHKMDAQQPLPIDPVTTDMALKAIVRLAKALQKEAKVTANFKANLPAICDKPKCQICDPSVRRIRFRTREALGASRVIINFKEKIDKLGERFPELWKMFFTRVRWEKWYENSEERIDVRHFVMDKQALEWAMMFLGHGDFSERKTRRRGHDDPERTLRNRSRWIRKLRGAIASMLRNWETISCQLGRTMRKRQGRRREKERRRVWREEKRNLRDEIEKCAGDMSLYGTVVEPKEDKETTAELKQFDNEVVELDWLKQFAKARKAKDVQAEANAGCGDGEEGEQSQEDF